MIRFASRAVLLIAAILVVAGIVTALAEDGLDDRVSWLEQHVIPLDSCLAESGLEDLAPLAAMVGDAQIVGLGESTHGTREHFQMKHRLVEYLVEELGFTWFAIEASTPEAHRLDAYVLGGDGDPEELIRGMYFWTWTTEEVLAMVEWMRAHNARSDHKIHFTGFDMQTPDVALEEVEEFLAKADRALADRLLAAHPSIVNVGYELPCAASSYMLDPEGSRGETVRFTAWIRTKDVRSGHAGLWYLVTGREGEPLAHGYMHDRGLSGTNDWTECEVELPVDETAHQIVFGFLLTGQGKAWFDKASLSVNGTDLDTTKLDLGFEGDLAIGTHTNLGRYSTRIDRFIAYSGAQSLQLSGSPSTPSAAALIPNAEEIFAEMKSARDEWLAVHPVKEVDRALLNMRIAVQYLRMVAGQVGASRDAAMAENVAWLSEQYPSERIILWAHNGHINRMPGMMGSHLAERFGEAYLPIGFATASGKYTAYGSFAVQAYDLQVPPAESFEATFAAATTSDFVLDLRDVDGEDIRCAWLAETRPFRMVGAAPMDEQFFDTPLSDYYDLIVFIEETTAARQL